MNSSDCAYGANFDWQGGINMSMINVANLTFAYDGSFDNIFEDVNFQIDTDWKLGFIGRNGRGKSTFLNLLLGKYQYKGTISSNAEFAYFPYPVSDTKRDTLDVMRDCCPLSEDWEMMREISLLDVSAEVLYRPFDTLSNGEQTKVLLAALFLGENRFLLIDEPTNHLDADAKGCVGDYLKRKKGFILVSHDRVLLDECVDHILSINKANIDIQQGNFSSWWNNKQLQDSFEMAENTKLQREIGRLSSSAKRSANWSDKVESSKNGILDSGLKADKGYVGHKSAKMMKRAKNIDARRQDAIEKKSKLLHNIEQYESLKISPIEYQKNVLVEVNDLSLFYGDVKVCGDLRFQVMQGDRIALNGKNGCGKSSLLKLICGKDIKYTGSLILGSGLKISYLPQDTSFLSGNLSDYANEQKIDESLFKSILRKLGFERIQFEKDMSNFSAGQKKKVLIAMSLCQQAHLYIWDEPLNFIDVFSRIQIEDLILEYQPTLLFVEHDSSFQSNIATKTINL